MCGFGGINACFLIFFVLVCFFLEQLFGFSLDDFVFFGLNGFFEIFGLLGQEALGVDLVKLFDERLSFCWGCGIDSCGSIVQDPYGGKRPPYPLRCWQFRLKEPRIRTPSPMLGQAMFICVPSALWQRN
ncbi:hypothetical protein CIP101434_02211 [Corynebacterium diphtheriae]|nr:hypothetical protein CIP101434_02211 [Corynebacterium diphtheriae]